MTQDILLTIITGPAHVLNFAACHLWMLENGHRPSPRICFLNLQTDCAALDNLANLCASLESCFFPDAEQKFLTVPAGSYQSVQKSLIDAISANVDVGELWLSRPGCSEDMALLELFPDPPVVLFNEGFGLSHNLGGAMKIKHRIVKVVTDLPGLCGQENRIAGKPAQLIPHGIIRSVQEKAFGWLSSTAGFELPDFPEEKPLAVVFGKSLYIFDDCTYEDELAHYVDLISTLLDDGFAVLWLDHPRAPAPFSKAESFRKLLAMSDVYSLAIPPGFPFEVVAGKMDISLTVSTGSTAQLSLLERDGVAAQISVDSRLNSIEKRPAIRFLKSVLPQRIVNDTASTKLGIIQPDTTDPYGAEQVLRQGILKNPKVECLYRQLGILLANTGRAEEVVALIEQGIGHMPQKASLRLMLGSALKKTGNQHDVAAAFRMAAKISPEDPYVQHRVAYGLQSLGETND